MAITTNDFNSLTTDLQSIFNERAENAVAESVGLRIFDVKDTERKTHEHQVLHGIAGIKKVAEGANYPNIGGQEGDSITYTQSKYGGLVPVTEEMRLYDLYDQIIGLAESVTDDAFDKIDQSYSDVLLNGWATSYTDVYGETVTSVGPDGLALFSASHTNGATATTYSNIIFDGTNTNPALSRAAIVNERAIGRRFVDVNGIHRPINLDTLVVGPGQEDLANRIIRSEQIQGSANNDINASVRSINIEVWDRLDSNSAGTDTSAYWFMMDSRKAKETLKSFFRVRPTLLAPNEVYENGNWEYVIKYFYSRGIGFAPYVRGSKGDNS